VKILIAPDKFKGTLTAIAAAEAFARGWQSARPDDELELLPMSDGGDGFGEVISASLGAKVQRTKTVDAAHRPCIGRWWWEPKTRTAVIESAKIIGLAMLPSGKFYPFELDTFGLGAVLKAARAKGPRHCLIGIGGSATNDGGFGMARALGWRFLDAKGRAIDRWTDLNALASVRKPPRSAEFQSVTVAVDVQNRLLGPKGATRVYGPQKRLRPQDFPHAERCLRRLAAVMERESGGNFAAVAGAGAAGGLGFGLLAFLDARLAPGFDLFAKHTALEKHLHQVDMVITGEGAIDRSTLMGKGVGQIARRCRELKIPCIGVAGIVDAPARLSSLFAAAHALTDLTSAKQARAGGAAWLERLAAKVARQISTAKRGPNFLLRRSANAR
jgi:glycerate kinase